MILEKSRTVLIALAIGFFVVWILEWRRTSLAESYWLLLAALTSLLSYQYFRIREAAGKTARPAGSTGEKRAKSSKKKRRK